MFNQHPSPILEKRLVKTLKPSIFFSHEVQDDDPMPNKIPEMRSAHARRRPDVGCRRQHRGLTRGRATYEVYGINQLQGTAVNYSLD